MHEFSLVIALASIVMSGVFLAFSSFVMSALGHIAPAEGIRAMQRINIDVFCWSFAILFFSIPIATLGLGLYALLHLSRPESLYFIVGSSVYLIGCVLVTALGNVPLNNALARIDADTKNAERYWRKYLKDWTLWNHIRTTACLISGLILASASIYL